MSRNAQQAHREAIQVQRGVNNVLLGPYSSHSMVTDARHLGFVLARYKFCARMLEGRRTVMEVGCGDGIGLPVIAQSVQQLYATDWDQDIIDDAQQRLAFLENCCFQRYDATQQPFREAGPLDAIYLLDVLEHLDPSLEREFLTNVTDSLSDDGVCIIGTPNIEAARFSTPQSQAGHINLKSHESLRALAERHFKQVFLFCMNDEVLHTGFYPMAHYFLALAVNRRSRVTRPS